MRAGAVAILAGVSHGSAAQDAGARPSPGRVPAPAALGPAAAIPGPICQLQSLEAFLFDARTGTVGPSNVAVEPNARHIPAELLDARKGSAERGPSHATLVVVGVAGLFGGKVAPGAVVTVTASTPVRTLLQAALKLPAHVTGGQPTDVFKIPVVLQDTGCDQVRVVASLRPGAGGKGPPGKSAVLRLERVLPFHCTD